jgi:hypothetical protein
VDKSFNLKTIKKTINIMETFFWEYKKNRKSEIKRNDLPKSRASKVFKTKKEALKYATERKSDWLQATLYKSVNGGGSYKQIAGIGIKGKYSETYF